jgi:hypothetical protein
MVLHLEKQDVVLEQQMGLMVISDDDVVELEVVEMTKGKKTKKKIKKKVFEIYAEEKYNRIIHALTKNHMTLEDITNHYNKAMNDNKKKITIYTYIQDLITSGLVIKIGKRVIKKENGKIVTETLYGNKAKLTFYEDNDYWQQKDRKIIASKISNLFDLYLERPKQSDETIKELINKMHVLRNNEIHKFLKENIDEFMEITGYEYFDDINTILRILANIIVLYKYDNFTSEMKKLKN